MTDAVPTSPNPHDRSQRAIEALLWILAFDSGACALVYQLTWMRQLRFVFGSTTEAIAAVTAAFMISLGAGSEFWGKRVDRTKRPMRSYAIFEAAIVGCALLSLPILEAIESRYASLSGFSTSVVRFAMALAMVGPAAFFMGGTLPALSRVVAKEGDRMRSKPASLYAANILGAVVGCFFTTYALHETLGQQGTLLAAILLNAGVCLAAYAISAKTEDAKTREDSREGIRPGSPHKLVVRAVAVALGFVFFSMEIVWYRLLAPLLGGTVYAYGTILAMALLGMGAGAWFYARLRRYPPLSIFVLACGLEAVVLALPYAVGDRFAYLARWLQAKGHFDVGGWSLLAALFVTPAAIAAGIQIPAWIASVGEGRRSIGRHVGSIYFWNTLGALAGSMATGFGLLPAFTALGVWKGLAVLQALVGLAVASIAGRPRLVGLAVAAVSAVGILFQATGPTAIWRHEAVGARSAESRLPSAQAWERRRETLRSSILEEAEGRESSVAIVGQNDREGPALMINGRSDATGKGDAATQIMLGTLAPLLRPGARNAFVVGFGTGSSAGWLAHVPGVEQVDVAELEPAVVRLSRHFLPVNRAPLENPKVRVIAGDAREILSRAGASYDLIVSEPSTLYRAGVAGLFSRDFYSLARKRLASQGAFVQWLQAYEVDQEVVRGVMATMLSVFPNLEIWETMAYDLLLIATQEPRRYEIGELRQRIASEPFRSALSESWRVDSLEGVFSRYVGGTSVARAFVNETPAILNTDDRTWIEFSAARALQAERDFEPDELRALASTLGDDRPWVGEGRVDWERLPDARDSAKAFRGISPHAERGSDPGRKSRCEAKAAYVAGNLRLALERWQSQREGPSDLFELALLAESTAAAGLKEAEGWIQRLEPYQPVEAATARALLHWKRGRHDEAGDALLKAFSGFAGAAWAYDPLLGRTFNTVGPELAARDPLWARRAIQALERPFSMGLLDSTRNRLRQRMIAKMQEAPNGNPASRN